MLFQCLKDSSPKVSAFTSLLLTEAEITAFIWVLQLERRDRKIHVPKVSQICVFLKILLNSFYLVLNKVWLGQRIFILGHIAIAIPKETESLLIKK